jgi:hypothetical protein
VYWELALPGRLLFFDGQNSRQIVETVLDGLQLRGRARVRSFA